ncbi:hypothetical protein WJX79_002056 [Trebouxia sp. C0005]
MAWGAKGGRGVDDLVERLTRGDPSLSSLHIFASRKFGREEVQKLCQALRANTTLKELYASGHHLTPQTAGMLGAMLAANTSLVSICLGDDALGDAGVLELVDGVKQNSTLQKVDLENKGISSKGADSIAAAIQGHQSLQQLVLAHNHLSDEGVRLLQPALALLRRLDLRGCHIGSQGAQCLATALREAHSLEVLRLDDNPLTEHGGSALAAGVWHSQSLRELHLCNTGIGDEGLSRLAQALTHASQLTYLDELGEAMQQSSSLQDLDLAGNQVGIQGLKCLSAASVLQKLCLFNCKLGQEAADIVSCFKDNGFSNVRELDLTGNEVEGPQMQSVLEAVQQQDVAPALKVLIIGGNPAAQTDSFSELVDKARAARPTLDIAWQATDPGQGG